MFVFRKRSRPCVVFEPIPKPLPSGDAQTAPPSSTIRIGSPLTSTTGKLANSILIALLAFLNTSILLALSDVLEVTVDQILNAGEFRKRMNKKINVEEVIKAIKSILRIKEVLGANNGIYKSMMAGLNDNHEVDFEELLKIPEKREVLVAKSCIQLIVDGYTLSEEDITHYFKNEKIQEKLRLYVKKYNQA